MHTLASVLERRKWFLSPTENKYLFSQHYGKYDNNLYQNTNPAFIWKNREKNQISNSKKNWHWPRMGLNFASQMGRQMLPSESNFTSFIAV
jgi:hypothetical protein